MSPVANGSSRRFLGTGGSRAATLTALGSVLVGVAAVAALFVGTDKGSNDTSPPAPSPGPVVLDQGRLDRAESFEEVGRILSSASGGRLVNDDGSKPVAGLSEIQADDGQVSGLVPTAWDDRETTKWLDDQDRVLGAAILAAPVIDDLYRTSDAPGVFLGVSPLVAKPVDLLMTRHEKRRASCSYVGTSTLIGDGFTGSFSVWTECGEPGSVAVDLAANSSTSGGTVLLFGRAKSAEDLEALQSFLSSLTIDVNSVVEKVGRIAPGRTIE